MVSILDAPLEIKTTANKLAELADELQYKNGNYIYAKLLLIASLIASVDEDDKTS